MDFDGTPLNITTLLVVALAVVAIVFLMRKRFHSNLPLLFYVAALALITLTDRGVNPILMYSGLALALLLRFEFMNNGFSKVIAFLAGTSMGAIVYVFLAEVFNDGRAPF